MSDEAMHTGSLRRLDTGGFEGKLERVYEGHDRGAVWRMLTEPAAMGQWLAPSTIELHKGGKAHIDFEDSGIVIDSEVLACEPEQELAYSWSSAGEPQRPLHWQLTDADNGTRLTLTVSVPAEEDAAKACAGFEAHLEMLGGALEGVPMQFPFDLFMQARSAYNAQLEH